MTGSQRSGTVVRIDEPGHRLAALRRAIARGGRILATQQGRLQELRSAGRDASLAQSLLANFEDSQLALFHALRRKEAQASAHDPSRTQSPPPRQRHLPVD